MAEIIEMKNPDGTKERMGEIRIKGEIIPFVKSIEFLLLHHFDNKMTLQISNRTTGGFEIMIINSDEFFSEVEKLKRLIKQEEKNNGN